MLKNKSLYNKMFEKLNEIWLQKNKNMIMSQYLKEKYNFLQTEYMEYVIGVRDFSEMKDEYLFWLIDGINYTLNVKIINIDDYFSESEIRQFSNMKYVFYKKEKYPIVINDVKEVRDDQWVTVLSFNELKELYDKQLIIYNPNTQRELKQKMRDGVIYFVADVRTSSVNEIKNLLLNDEYIPDDLTFNLNLDNPDIEFDIVGNKIIVTGGQFDIIDGFHRFRACIEAKAINPDFNYNFVINIMNFDENKANTYIAQRDKRNKINITFSKAIDSTSPTKIIVDRINSSPNCLWKGLIGKAGINVINVTEVFGLIDYLYDSRKLTRSELIRTANHIINVINLCVDAKPELLNGTDFVELAIIISGTQKSPDEYICYEEIKKAISKKDSLGKISNKVNSKNMNQINSLFD